MPTTEIESADVKRLLLRVYRRYCNKEISEATARQETFILNSVLKAIVTSDLEARLQKIQGVLERDKK